jgi:hypothetical protein
MHFNTASTRSLLFIFITSALVFYIGITKPIYNWDMIGYTAAAYYKDGYRGKDLSEYTYGDIRKEVSDWRFAAMIEGDGDYRSTVYTDPTSLEQQVPLYSMRVIYIELIRLLKFVGLEHAKSTYIISAFFSSLSIIVLGLILLKKNIPILTLPIIALLTGYESLARFSSPDSLALFFAILATYLMVTNKIKSLLILSIALPLVRTDYILLSVLLMIYSAWYGERISLLISLACTFFAYILVNKLNGNYGYLNIFNFALIKISPYPADLVPSNDFWDYLKPYIHAPLGFVSKGHNPAHAVIYFISAIILVGKWRMAIKSRDFYILFAIPLAYVFLHLVLFPVYRDRFFAYSASITLIGIIYFLRFCFDNTDKDNLFGSSQ